MSSDAVIDFRIRPPYGTYQTFVNQIGQGSIEQLGFDYTGSLKTKAYDDFVAELDRAHVEKAVLQGRHGFMGMYVENRELFDLVERDPERFIAFPFIEALAPDASQQVDDLVLNGPGAGVALEPGIATRDYPAFPFDDKRAYPLYDKLQANRIPILLTYSLPALERLDPDTPRQLDAVALDFPDLVIVVAHGGWPWTLENIGIAWRRPNVYLVPDIYAAGVPGTDDYIHAARTILRDKIVFGSSYPITPIDQYVTRIETSWGLDEETTRNVLYNNAAKILGV